MAVEGDLMDIPATSLVQTVCYGRKKTGMQLARPGEEGLMIFEEGQIVHAQAGLLEGEEAVYYLLSWSEGRFRLSEDIASTERTVRMGWNELLLEGMRRLDEGQERPGSGPALDPAREQLEERLEVRLLALLSRLEQLMVKLGERRPRAAATFVSGTAELVNLVLEFQEKRPDDGPRSVPLVKVLALTNARFPFARILEADGRRLSARMATRMFESWDGPADRKRYVFNQLAEALLWMLKEYFTMFGRTFRSESRERQWRETYSVFVRELERLKDEFEF